MCCKQRTCAILKSFRCNTYEKHRGVMVLWLTRNPGRIPALNDERVTRVPTRSGLSGVTEGSDPVGKDPSQTTPHKTKRPPDPLGEPFWLKVCAAVRK